MSKPQLTKEVATSFVYKARLIIEFYGTPDAAKDFESFGEVALNPGKQAQYTLYVDARYDFDEVVLYVENYY